MEHLFHVFGGGCGEHMIWQFAGIGIAGGSGVLAWSRLVLMNKWTLRNKDLGDKEDA